MGHITYLVQHYRGHENKHHLDYQFCKKYYKKISSMNLDELSIYLSDSKNVGEMGHLTCFVLWFKAEVHHKAQADLSDYGRLHLLFHFLEFTWEPKKHAQYIHGLIIKISKNSIYSNMTTENFEKSMSDSQKVAEVGLLFCKNFRIQYKDLNEYQKISKAYDLIEALFKCLIDAGQIPMYTKIIRENFIKQVKLA